MAFLMLSPGMFSALAALMAPRKRGFLSGSPPLFAAMVISLIRRVKILPRLASSAPFLCLIVAHLLWPDMRYLAWILRCWRPSFEPPTGAPDCAARGKQRKIIAADVAGFLTGTRQAVGRLRWSREGVFHRLLVLAAVGVDHGEQRRGEQDAPERDDDAQHDGSEDRGPDGHLDRPLHDVGLQP